MVRRFFLEETGSVAPIKSAS
jgi:hypothetical protein